MKKTIWLSVFVFGLIYSIPNLGVAQPTTTTTQSFTIQHNDPNNEVLCRTPGSENLPQCQNRQNNNRQNINEPFHRTPIFMSSIEKAVVINYRNFNMINIPADFMKPDLPPYWMKICRPWPSPAKSGDYITPIEVSVDNKPKIKINDRGCTFVPFAQSIVVSTISSTDQEFDYQFLGRA